MKIIQIHLKKKYVYNARSCVKKPKALQKKKYQIFL